MASSWEFVVELTGTRIGRLLLLGFQGINSKSSSIFDDASSLLANRGILISRVARFCGFDKSRFTSTASDGLRDHGKSDNRLRIMECRATSSRIGIIF